MELAQKIELKLLSKTQHIVPLAAVHIGTTKLKKLMEESTSLLKFAMCVEQLVENDYQLMKKYLPEKQVNSIKSILEPIHFKTCTLSGFDDHEFRRKLFRTESSASNIEAFYAQYKDKTAGYADRKEVDSVLTAINILYSLSETHVQLYSPEMLQNISPTTKELIRTMERLFQHIMREMAKSPKEVENQEIELSRMFTSYEHLNVEILLKHHELASGIAENLKRIMRAHEEVQALQEQRRNLREYLIQTYQKIRNNLEKNTAVYKFEALKATKEKSVWKQELESKHEQMVQQDLAEEKALRTEKYKTEQVLKGVMNKYEEDMNQRNKKLAHTTEIYEKESALMREMQERYNAQDEIYQILMKEKSDYERMMWLNKIRTIRRKIAARKIQRFYRSYLAFMQAHGKKKGKGRGRGKKKN